MDYWSRFRVSHVSEEDLEILLDNSIPEKTKLKEGRSTLCDFKTRSC